MMDNSQNAGHRERLREKFLAGKLADYELLELLISYAILRRDVKPIAKGLIKKFGNIHRVLTANVNELSECDGVGKNTAVLISLIREFMLQTYRRDMGETPLFHNVNRLHDYCRMMLMGKRNEEFHVMYLDKVKRLIADEEHSTGTTDNVAVYPREILKRALDLGAKFVVLYHNHPDKDGNFSGADIEITAEVNKVLGAVGIGVIDHLLVANDLIYSAKNLMLYR